MNNRIVGKIDLGWAEIFGAIVVVFTEIICFVLPIGLIIYFFLLQDRIQCAAFVTGFMRNV